MATMGTKKVKVLRPFQLSLNKVAKANEVIELPMAFALEMMATRKATDDLDAPNVEPFKPDPDGVYGAGGDARVAKLEREIVELKALLSGRQGKSEQKGGAHA